jgi:hypothetical protein
MIERIATRLAIFRLCRRVKRQAVGHGVKASVFWFGAYWIHPKHLAVIIRVRTDSEKSKLIQDQAFWHDIKADLASVGYPAVGRDGVAFEAESDETVNREWEGNWWYRFK